MANSLKKVFDDHTQFQIDRRFIKQVYLFVQNFINKNSEHSEFFGGHLLGVQRPVWVEDVDGEKWLEEVLLIDDISGCQSDIYELEDINPSWVVSSNITNLSFLYLTYRLHNSSLSRKDKEQAIIYTIMAAHIKHLCSGLRRRFPYRANEGTAMAHFESLDYRTDLKRLGSWFALLENRGGQVVDKDFLWKKQLKTFETTYEIMTWANDLQDRLTDVLNKLTSSFHDVRAQEAKIMSSSRLKEYDGVPEYGPVRNTMRDTITRIQTALYNPNDFLKVGLIEDSISVIHTAEERHLRKVINYVIDNPRDIDDIEKYLERVVLLIFSTAKANDLKLTEVPMLVHKLRTVMRSSRSKDTEAIFIKDYGRSLMEVTLPKVRDNIKASTSLAFFIYISLLVFTLK